MQIEHYQEGAFAIHDFLSPMECQELIYRSEISDYHRASVHHPRRGPLLLTDIRNNDRVNLEDQSLASDLFDRVRGMLPPQLDRHTLLGLSPHFRFYRYEVGQFFKWHRDGYVGQGESMQSLLTFLIYLNEDYSGGETEFRWGRVPTKTGKALVFPHRLVHQGATVEQGVKYVLRTDVMYSATCEQTYKAGESDTSLGRN